MSMPTDHFDPFFDSDIDDLRFDDHSLYRLDVVTRALVAIEGPLKDSVYRPAVRVLLEGVLRPKLKPDESGKGE